MWRPYSELMRSSAWLLLVFATCGCVTLTPEGARVAVYTAKFEVPPARRQMPDGCLRLGVLPEDRMSEMEMEGLSDPFRKQRNAAGSAGGNVLLMLKRAAGARRDPECPGAARVYRARFAADRALRLDEEE